MLSGDPAVGPNPSGLCQCGCGMPTPLAKYSTTRTGAVKGQPVRFIHGHNARNSPVPWVRDPETGCDIWQGARKTNGYGVKVLRADGGCGYTSTPAHRWRWVEERGPIPEGLEPHHLCNNRPCVRLEHLTLVTHHVNMQVSESAKLTRGIVVELRRRRAAGEGANALAKEFGVHPDSVRNAVSGKTWANVPGALVGAGRGRHAAPGQPAEDG